MTVPDALRGTLEPGTMLMEYRVGSVLGAGGFGVTYLAEDTHLEKQVALKEYLPAALAVRALDGSVVPVDSGTEFNFRWGLEQFLLEARTLARFTHHAIVRVARYFEANGTAYMVMEYEKGESFSAWLSRNRRPDETALKRLAMPLLEGLAAVHAAGLLHGDVKPANIIVRDSGEPVLIDFGAARHAVRTRNAPISIVTPGYSPPEMYRLSGRLGPWTDIYGLAGVLYRALTDDNPPDAKTRARDDDVVRKLASARVRYSGAFVAAVEWALALEERRRPQDINEWRAALLRGNLSRSAAAPPRKVAEAADTGSRWIWMAAGILVLFVFTQSRDILEGRLREISARRTNAQPVTTEPNAAADAFALREFQRADGDGSGGLTRDEVIKYLPELAPRFDEVDADRNARITLDELQEFWRRQHEAMTAAPGETVPARP